MPGNLTGSTGKQHNHVRLQDAVHELGHRAELHARVPTIPRPRSSPTDPLSGITCSTYNYAGENPLTYDDPTGLFLGIPGTPTNGEVMSAGGKVLQAVGGVVVEGAEALRGGLESLGGYAVPIVTVAACLAAPEVCETVVTGGLVVDMAIGTLEVSSDPAGVLERLQHMSVLDYTSGLDQTLVLAGPALAAVELRATEAALQGAARPGGAMVLVC